LASNDIDASTGFIAVTSRASFEMVQKTAMAGVSVLAAVSAPTSFAVKTADDAGLTLVGFARQQDLAIYSHPQRIALDGAESNLESRHAH
jgi:FdhD protein